MSLVSKRLEGLEGLGLLDPLFNPPLENPPLKKGGFFKGELYIYEKTEHENE